MTVAWVLGCGGLLGSALCRTLRHDGVEVFVPAGRLCWDHASRLENQLAGAVREFAVQAAAFGRWEIYWAAGVGAMGSSEADLVPETMALALVLRLLEAQPSLMATAGSVAFASSAGAIYSGTTDALVTEGTPVAPTTAYAYAKVEQEKLIRAFAQDHVRVSALVARISTLYGPGGAATKRQGLLTHIARSMLRNVPIQIYVPFDTIRDYIGADDAAAQLIVALRAMDERLTTKIIASEQPVTIAEIVSIFRRIARRAPRIATSSSRLSALYPRCVQFRSIVLPQCANVPRTSLPVGIARLMAAERDAYARGRGAMNRSD